MSPVAVLSAHTPQRKTILQGGPCPPPSHLCWPLRPGFDVFSPLPPPLSHSPAFYILLLWVPGLPGARVCPPPSIPSAFPSTMVISHPKTTVVTFSYCPVSSWNKNHLCTPLLAILEPGRRSTSFPSIPQRLFSATLEIPSQIV